MMLTTKTAITAVDSCQNCPLCNGNPASPAQRGSHAMTFSLQKTFQLPNWCQPPQRQSCYQQIRPQLSLQQPHSMLQATRSCGKSTTDWCFWTTILSSPHNLWRRWLLIMNQLFFSSNRHHRLALPHLRRQHRTMLNATLFQIFQSFKVSISCCCFFQFLFCLFLATLLICVATANPNYSILHVMEINLLLFFSPVFPSIISFPIE